MAELLKGKPIADKAREGIKKEISKFTTSLKLVTLQIGKNDASDIYIKSQKKEAEALGFQHEIKKFGNEISQKQAEKAVIELNERDDVNAIIIELPVPKHIDIKALRNLLNPMKDVESVHPENLGKIIIGAHKIAPCTAMAVMELIKSTGVKLYGKEAVCVGHSEIAGRPLAQMLLNEFATTTVCHIGTHDSGKLAEHVKKAEILVVAVGKPGLIKGEWVKKGAIVIDVGINKNNGKIVGDVEFEGAEKRAAFITPVPGGVGPLTVVMLMRNAAELYKMQS